METISPKQLREARDLFRTLLGRDSKEREFQHFFAQHPYVLLPSLPLRLEPRDIVPMGRPGQTELDFIFYPHNLSPIPYYGIIELKRPDQKIATITRSNMAILARDAQFAAAQAQQYIESVPDLIQNPLSSGHLFLGNDRYLFVIIGLTSRENILDVNQKTSLQSIQNQLRPFRNLHILPYYYLLKNFEKRIYRCLHIMVPQADVFSLMRLRTQPRLDLSNEEVRVMLQQRGFYDRYWTWVGTGLKHQYEVITRNHAKLVVDRMSDLMWQQSGFEKSRNSKDAQNYIQELNQEKFAGYNDWRLPTLEEAMSLMESKKNTHDLYIDRVFDETQHRIWTMDKPASGRAWSVDFSNGFCDINFLGYGCYVRAVRSGHSII